MRDGQRTKERMWISRRHENGAVSDAGIGSSLEDTIEGRVEVRQIISSSSSDEDDWETSRASGVSDGERDSGFQPRDERYTGDRY